MTEDLDALKRQVQDFFSDGLVVIVGSGLSCAEGVPGMPALADHLLDHVPRSPGFVESSTWIDIRRELKQGKDLETTLLNYAPDMELEATIVKLTAELIRKHESQIISEVVAGTRTLRFTRLLPHLLKPNTGIPVITTNYDRLIEVAAEAAGLSVDCLFVGHNLARLDPHGSRMSLCREIRKVKRSFLKVFAEHVVLLKPHGSLDWYLKGHEPYRMPIDLDLPRLIITPGLNKFRGGYNRPFDTHRERANREIDRADRFLVIGYGFNDDHLQTHLDPQLRNGKPAMILVRSMSEQLRQLTTRYSNATVVHSNASPDAVSVTSGGHTRQVLAPPIWDLNHLITEVLTP